MMRIASMLFVLVIILNVGVMSAQGETPEPEPTPDPTVFYAGHYNFCDYASDPRISIGTWSLSQNFSWCSIFASSGSMTFKVSGSAIVVYVQLLNGPNRQFDFCIDGSCETYNSRVSADHLESVLSACLI